MTKKMQIEFATEEQQFCAEVIETMYESMQKEGIDMLVFMEVCLALSNTYLMHEGEEEFVGNMLVSLKDIVDQAIAMGEEEEPEVWH